MLRSERKKDIKEYKDLREFFSEVPYHVADNIVEMVFPEANSPEGKKEFVEVYQRGIEDILNKTTRTHPLQFGPDTYNFLECHGTHKFPMLLVNLYYGDRTTGISYVLKKKDLYVLAFTSNNKFFEIREKNQAQSRLNRNFPLCQMNLSSAYSRKFLRFAGKSIRETIIFFSGDLMSTSSPAESQSYIEVIYWFFSEAARFTSVCEENSKLLEEDDWNVEKTSSDRNVLFVHHWGKLSKALRGDGNSLAYIKLNKVVKELYEVRPCLKVLCADDEITTEKRGVAAPADLGLKGNIRLLNSEQEVLANQLLVLDQGHLFEDWPKQGDDDVAKAELLKQISLLNTSYNINLLSFLQEARKSLIAEKNPFDGFLPYGKVAKLVYFDKKPWLEKDPRDKYKIQIMPIRHICLLPHDYSDKIMIANHLTMAYGLNEPYLKEERKRALLYDYHSIFLIDACTTTTHLVASCLSDGAILLVDVMEGVNAHTCVALKQILSARVTPCLVLSNVEQLLNNQNEAKQAYKRLLMIIQEVNGIYGDNEYGSDFFGFEKRNVVIASALHEWGFNINSGEEFLASKLKGSHKSTVGSFVLKLIWEFYQCVSTRTNDNDERLQKALKNLNLCLSASQLENLDDEAIIRYVMKKWFSLPKAILSMIITSIPDISSQPSRFSKIPSEEVNLLNVSNRTQIKLEQVQKAIRACSSHSFDPCVVFVLHMFKDSGVDESEEECFLAFARIFSGILKPAQAMFLIPHGHDPLKIDQKLAQKVEVGALYCMKGEKLEDIPYATAGDVIAIKGIGDIGENVTISSTLHCWPLFSDMQRERTVLDSFPDLNQRSSQ